MSRINSENDKGSLGSLITSLLFLLITGTILYLGSSDINNKTNTRREEQETKVYLYYYDPTKGGINCDYDCSTTANGTKILDARGNPISSYWWNGQSAGAACPPEDPFGTLYKINFDGYEIRLECIDRGSGIIEKPDGKIIDILHYDGVPQSQYNPPVTRNGIILNQGPHEAKRITP